MAVVQGRTLISLSFNVEGHRQIQSNIFVVQLLTLRQLKVQEWMAQVIHHPHQL